MIPLPPAQQAEAARESARFYGELAKDVHPAFGSVVPFYEREAERLSEVTD